MTISFWLPVRLWFHHYIFSHIWLGHAKVPDMQNCRYLPLPVTSWARKKSDMFHGTIEITPQENLNSKVRDWTTNCKIHCFLLGVNIDGVQEHYHACVKITIIRWTPFFVQKTLFWNGQTILKAEKWNISMRDIGSMTIPKDFKDCKNLIFRNKQHLMKMLIQQQMHLLQHNAATSHLLWIPTWWQSPTHKVGVTHC